MFHDEPIVMDFVGQPNDESNEVYFYFQLRNNTNDTMIFISWYHFIANLIFTNLRTHDYVFCEQSTQIEMHEFKLSQYINMCSGLKKQWLKKTLPTNICIHVF